MSVAPEQLDPDFELAQAGRRSRQPKLTREVILVATALAAFVAAQVAVVNPHVLLARPFWLDEMFTALPATDPSLSHAVRAVRSGLDTNPPVLHLLMAILCRTTGARPELVLRLAALAFAWLGLVAVYGTLRRSFGVLSSVTAVLAVWMHPLVQHAAFEGRFYAPLLAGVAWVAFGLTVRGWIGIVVTALASGFTGSIHYFGTPLVACVALGELAFGAGTFVERFRRILPTLAAPLCVLPFLPFIRDQSAGLAMRTWLTRPHFPQIDETIRLIAFPYPLVIVMLAAWGSRLSGRRDVSVDAGAASADDAAPTVRRRSSLAASASLLGLLAFPVILLVLSRLIQPVFLPRYMVPVVLALCPLIALGASLASRRGQIAAAVALAAAGPLFLRSTSWELAGHGQIMDAVIAAARADDKPYPMFFPNSHLAFELWRYAPDLRPRIHVLDTRPLGTALVPARFYYDLDQLAKSQTMYELPQLSSLAELRTASTIRLAGAPPDIADLAAILPVRAAEQPGVYRVVTAAER